MCRADVLPADNYRYQTISGHCAGSGFDTATVDGKPSPNGIRFGRGRFALLPVRDHEVPVGGLPPEARVGAITRFIPPAALIESRRARLSYFAEEPLQFRFERYVCRRSAWPAKPRIERIPGQPVLGAWLARVYLELVQPLRVVLHVLASTEARNRQSHRLV